MKQIIKQNTDILIITIFVMAIGLGKYNFAFYLTMFLSNFGFITIFFPPVSTNEPDERNWFINNKASTISFAVTMIIASFASLGIDSIEPFNKLEPKTLFQMFLVFLYTFYLFVYAVLKRRY